MPDVRKNEPKLDADDILGGIVEWVSIESPSHDAKSVNKVVDHVEGQFRDLGLTLDRTPGRDGFGDILTCATTPEMTKGEAGKGILVLAHLDTVHPIGMIEKDLKVRREGDSIFGPGIYDMKAGGYIAYYALRHLIRQGKKTKLPVTFLFIPEEEVGSPTSRSKIEELAKGHKYALVMEPGRDGDRVVTSRKGVGRFTLTVKGAASHAGVRHQDRSAIHEMAKQIMRIEGKTDYERGITCNVGLIQGGSGVNVVPAECRIDVDLRVPTPELAEEMVDWFLKLEPIGKEVELKVEGGMNRPPYTKDAGITDLFTKAQAIYREIGKELNDVPLTGGGSDGNFTAALGIPTLDGLGADGKGAHAAYEQIYYSSLVPRTYLCTRLLETLE